MGKHLPSDFSLADHMANIQGEKGQIALNLLPGMKITSPAGCRDIYMFIDVEIKIWKQRL